MIPEEQFVPYGNGGRKFCNRLHLAAWRAHLRGKLKQTPMYTLWQIGDVMNLPFIRLTDAD